MSPSTEPFNEAKYKALMDGLECSEVLLSELDYSNRLDAEYYQKLHLQYKNKIENIKHNGLDYYADFLIGPFGSAYDTSNYVDYSEYRYVRGQDVKPFELQSTSARYMAKEDYERLIKYALKPGDILVSVVGTIGNACIVQKKDVPGIFSCKSTVIRTKSINPYYITCYLNSKYGRSLLLRQERGAIQKGLNLDDLKVIPIPEFSAKLYQLFERLLRDVNILQDNSYKEYKSAECILLNELGIDMSTIPSGGVSVKTFSECFNVQNRIDAEFYQPKYDEILKAIKTYDTDAKTLDEIAKYVFTGECADEYFPYDLTLRHYVRGTDIHDGLVDIDLNYSVEAVKHTKFVSEGDIITGRVGTIGRFGVIPCELDGAVCSDNVLCFHLPGNYQPNVYALYFNSDPIKELTNRMSRGSVQQRLNQETLRELIVPLIKDDVQNEINERIHTSFILKAKAGQLLECAKSAVEMAIEKDEAKAISWLEEKISELTVEIGK